MTFHSILFRNAADSALEHGVSEPEFFGDLNLDQIIAAVTDGKDEYDLKPFFHLPLHDVDDVVFRQEVMRDLECPRLFVDIKAFAESMREMRQYASQAEKLSGEFQKQRWFLDAVDIYCNAVSCLADRLSRTELTSRGLMAFRDYVTRYVAAEGFTSLVQRTKKLTTDLSTIHYVVLIRGLNVQIRNYDGEGDYGVEVETTFEKFKQGAVNDYAFSFTNSPEMNHVEAMILEQVAKLYPDIFFELGNYVKGHGNFADTTIITFDREVQYYVAYLGYIARFRKAGLNFCYPCVTRAGKEVYNYQGFDLALAGKLTEQNSVPVCNDFHLKGRERIIIVSGPNQGGKTTFARTFGQLHYLASLGCPVPGGKAQLFLFDEILTHFEKEEDITNLRGKLQDDLIRVHDILERATPNSAIIMNEVFTSTTFRDASILSRKIAARITQLDLLCVWVTFIDELASLGDQTVSMVSTVVPDNPAVRTYKIVRREADGIAYALSIARKHRLTYAMIKERLESFRTKLNHSDGAILTDCKERPTVRGGDHGQGA
jgi:DNA mismatch repair ATPase MutS